MSDNEARARAVKIRELSGLVEAGMEILFGGKKSRWVVRCDMVAGPGYEECVAECLYEEAMSMRRMFEVRSEGAALCAEMAVIGVKRLERAFPDDETRARGMVVKGMRKKRGALGPGADEAPQ